MVRLAHLSDVHISATPLGWRWHDWLNKRLTSWINLRYFGRQKNFARADEVLGRLMDEVPGRGIDHIVFSGDATALGLEPEFRRAAQLLRVGSEPIPGLAVPGNHDYLTPGTASSGLFERYFAPWQHGRRVGNHHYPFAQRVGPIWLVGVNAATGNRIPFDASGAVGPTQRERLRDLLAELEPGPRLLVVHYPISLATGAPERPKHGLRDLAEVLAIAEAGGVSAWLHGHRHTPYLVDGLAGRVVAICAGSATQAGTWSYNEYTIDATTLQAVRRVFNPKTGGFEDVQTFDVRIADA